jgi:hypothetical protein
VHSVGQLYSNQTVHATNIKLICHLFQDQRTYVMACTDPRMMLVVVFDSKKDEKESHIRNFVSDLALQLRCNKVFADLKPNTK